MPAQQVGRLADFALAGQEDEDVAGAVARTFIDRVDDRIFEFGFVVVFFLRQRPVPELDRVHPARDFDHRRRHAVVLEVPGEPIRVERR